MPFPAGGPNDIIARVVGQRMSELIKQPVVIDNRGGQGGVLGTDVVAKAAPDGYTIAISSAGALAISPSMEKVAYDTLKDLQPITLVATVPEMLVVASNVPANDMKELVALAKAQPGKLNFASSGPGSLPHLAGELFKLTAKIDIVHVPYRGAAPAVNDLLGQQVQMAFLDLPVLLPQIKAGSLRGIAIGSPQRAPTAPDVPTTAEVGMPDLLIENWYGMVAPAGTPEAIVAALNRIATEAMRDPAVKEKLASQGAELIGDSPEHFRGFIDSRNREMGESDQGRRRRDREVASTPLMASHAGHHMLPLRRLAQMLHQLLRRPRQRLETAGADREPAVGPGVADPDHRDRHRSRATPRGGFRHHRDADAGRHHLADRVEIPQPRPESQAQAEPRGVFGDVDLQRGRVGQPDEIATRHLREIDLAAAGKLAAPRRHQHQPVLAERKPLDIVRQGMLGGKAEIGGAGGDRRGDIGAFALLDIDVDVGMFAQECRQRLRQMLRQARGVGEQMHAGLGAAGEGGEIAAHHLHIVHDDAGMIEQAFARRGQLDAAAAALEQRDAERRFQALDPRAGRGQRQMGADRAAR